MLTMKKKEEYLKIRNGRDKKEAQKRQKSWSTKNMKGVRGRKK